MTRPADTSPYSTLFQAPRKYSEWVRDHLQLYAGGEVRIRVSRPKRTTRANRYWWGYVLETIRQAMIEAGIGFMETNRSEEQTSELQSRENLVWRLLLRK